MKLINWENFFIPYRQVNREIGVKLSSYMFNLDTTNKHNPITSFSTRVKSVDSILKKCKKKDIPITEATISSKIKDISGVRIICKFVEDVDILIEKISTRKDFDIKIIEEKNFIANTKESGYRSYHMIVTYPIFIDGCVKTFYCEIQIRTLAMDFWSTIEHTLKYKYNGDIPEHVQKRLVKSADAANKLDIEMGMIREEIIEAEEIIKVRNRVVSNIENQIKSLYIKHGVDVGNEFNEKFFSLYKEGSLKDLEKFEEQLKLVSWL